MPSYAYRAYNESGQRRDGRIDAAGTSAAEQALWLEGLKIVDIRPAPPKKTMADYFPSLYQISRADIILFYPDNYGISHWQARLSRGNAFVFTGDDWATTTKLGSFASSSISTRCAEKRERTILASVGWRTVTHLSDSLGR